MSDPTTMQWIRQAGHRIYVGSGRLTAHLTRRAVLRVRAVWRRATDWLGEVSGLAWGLRLGILLLAATVLRKVAFGIAGAVYERIESGASWLLWPASALWVVSAYRAGREGGESKQRTDPAPASKPDEDDQEQHMATVGTPPLPTFQQLCEALARVGTPHAHIAVLADDLDTTPERVREALDRCGVPVTDVRMRGRGASTGIKGDALPTPHPPSDGVVGAGQPTNNDNNNTFKTVPDDTNPVRTHVVWRDRNAS